MQGSPDCHHAISSGSNPRNGQGGQASSTRAATLDSTWPKAVLQEGGGGQRNKNMLLRESGSQKMEPFFIFTHSPPPMPRPHRHTMTWSYFAMHGIMASLRFSRLIKITLPLVALVSHNPG
jgi:hypothetical protein